MVLSSVISVDARHVIVLAQSRRAAIKISRRNVSMRRLLNDQAVNEITALLVRRDFGYRAERCRGERWHRASRYASLPATAYFDDFHAVSGVCHR